MIRRINIQRILSDRIQCRRLFSNVIIATQERENITTTKEQAEKAYDTVQKQFGKRIN